MALSEISRWVRFYSTVKIWQLNRAKIFRYAFLTLSGKSNTKKSDCHIHAPVQQRLNAIYRRVFNTKLKRIQ